MAMLESMIQDGVAKKGLDVLDRVLDGDAGVSSAQHRAAMSVVSSEMKARGTRNRDITNAISVVKMHPEKEIRAQVADALIRRLVPEVSSGAESAASLAPLAAGKSLT